MGFPKGYLDSEIRNDVIVDSNRKKLWAVELDIAQMFDNICKKHNFTYFVLGGALIGAIRHQGFVPWDDDIDIGMLREDFDAFLKVAQVEFGNKYFVQTGINDDQYFSSIIRIRDKESTGIIFRDLERDCNNGVFIEIYPFDKVNPNKILYKIQKARIAILYRILYFSCYGVDDNSNIKAKHAQKVLADMAIRIFGKEKIFKRMNKIASKYNKKPFEYVDELMTPYNCRYLYNDLAETVDVPFEYLTLSIPSGYDRCLKTTYGDYMVMPPVEKRIDHHNRVVYYDPYHPYTDPAVIEKAKAYFRGE